MKDSDFPCACKKDHNNEVSNQRKSDSSLKECMNSNVSQTVHNIPIELDNDLEQYKEGSITSSIFICNFEKRTQMRKIMLQVLLKHTQNYWHLYEDFSENFIRMEKHLIL